MFRVHKGEYLPWLTKTLHQLTKAMPHQWREPKFWMSDDGWACQPPEKDEDVELGDAMSISVRKGAS